MFFVYAQYVHLRTTHKKCAKVRKKNDIHKKNVYFFAYFKKKQYLCTLFVLRAWVYTSRVHKKYCI